MGSDFTPAMWKTVALRTRSTVMLLLSLVLISACDGGIFGTGDSNSDEPIIASNTMDNLSESTDAPLEGEDAAAEPGANEPTNADTESADSQGEGSDGDNAPQMMPESNEDDALQTQPFTNTLAGYPGVEPQLRFANASGQALRVTIMPTSGEAQTMTVAADEVTAHSTLEIGETIIDIATADSTSASIRIVASLGTSSVSTVLLQGSDPEPDSLTALALPTQTSTDDASVSLLRIVAPASDSRLSTGVWRLTPTGENPGSVDASLSAIVDAESDVSYSSLAAGDYELGLEGEGILLPDIRLTGGSVKTLIVSGTLEAPRLLDVDDSDLAGLPAGQD